MSYFKAPKGYATDSFHVSEFDERENADGEIVVTYHVTYTETASNHNKLVRKDCPRLRDNKERYEFGLAVIGRRLVG